MALLALVAWAAHFSAPDDMHDDDQLKPTGYVMDILLNGRWVVQDDLEGAVCSKPPLYQWVCAPLAHATGKVGPLEMFVPTGLAIFGAALLCMVLARPLVRDARLGDRAAWLPLAAGAAMVLSPFTIKHMCMARSDAMFTCFVALGAWAALRAWNRAPGRSTGGRIADWGLFWLAATLATMTKGPLGVVLAANGLFACLWELRGRARGGTGEAAPGGARATLLAQAPGILFFLLMCGGWFWLAVQSDGQRVIDKMIGNELVGHASQSREGHAPFTRIYQPPLYFLSRYIPWAVPAAFALWRTVFRPAEDASARRTERFLFCWFGVGLLIFSIAPHQRADLLMPLIPAAAVLAARESMLWVKRLPLRGAAGAAGLVAALVIGYSAWWNHVGRTRDTSVMQTRDCAVMAEDLLRRYPGVRIEVVEPWYAQYALQMHKAPITHEVAAALLGGGEPVVVLSRNREKLVEALARAGVEIEKPAAHYEITPTWEGERGRPVEAWTNLR